MKIIIASDNHFNQQVLELIEARHQGEASLFIHCGDSQLPYESPLMEPYVKVAGNCDYDRSYPDEEVRALASSEQLFVAHGHLFGVKQSTRELEKRALELGATIACYGHSHCVDVHQTSGLLVINPGSTFLPRNTPQRTYATLNITETDYEVKIHQVETGAVLMEETFKKGG